MDQPLGRAVGNACEVAESLEILRGEGPADVRALTVRLGAEMLKLGGAARDLTDGARRIERAIASGAGLERFLRGVGLQGGDTRVLEHPERLPQARRQLVLRAARSGRVLRLDARAIGQAATLLGAGRLAKEDVVDPAVGILLHAKEGDRVMRGDGLATLCYNDDGRLQAARGLAEGAYTVGARSPSTRGRGRTAVSLLVRDRIA
jgi:pyrimidine-nucleoside phosphorylase/thymidine phosphorylase